MTPRLAVTREQADTVLLCRDGACPCRDGDLCHYVADGATPAMRRPWTVTLRLPERPTMPCPECGGYATDRWRCDGVEIDVVCDYCNGQSVVPIPEGTRVEVGWWEQVEDGHGYVTDVWHHVASATLAEVHDESCPMPHSPDCCGYCPESFVITLSHIKPAGEDQ